jgi:GNAT superfamily N-acetyltransferase
VWVYTGRMATNLSYRRATLAEITPGRFANLRPGMVPVLPYFDQDLHESTAHFGAFADGNLDAVSGLTLLRQARGDVVIYQLRGMFTNPEQRGFGTGRDVYLVAERWAGEQGATAIWCNARCEAIGFYERIGFACTSGRFDVPGVGPHRRMEKVFPCMGTPAR